MLSAAKHLCAHRDRPFAEFTLSEANVLRVTLVDCSTNKYYSSKLNLASIYSVYHKFIPLDQPGITGGLQLFEEAHYLIFIS